MRKNRMMRAASALLVAVLLTTSTISGTFAKYVTTAEGSDTARVAKWGVEVGVVGSLFEDSYKQIPEDDEDVLTVKSNDAADVVAPGTENWGELTFILKGKPEVETKVEFVITSNDGAKTEATDVVIPAGTYKDFTKVTGYDASGNPTYTDVEYSEYHPLVFVLKNSAGTVLYEGALAGLEEYLETRFNSTITYNPNKDLTEILGGDGTYTISWYWDFDNEGAGTNDKADTLLGQIAAEKVTVANASTGVDFELAITVTQVD